MKIVICDGHNEADYIIKMFKKKENTLIVINNDKNYASYLSKTHRIPVIYGDSYKKNILEEANIYNADVLIALNETNDANQFVICTLAKSLFNVKKVICTVKNPNNVDLFKELGVDSPISSSYLLGNSVRAESSVESLIKSMTLDDNKISMVEVTVSENFAICNRKIMEINFPKFANISCIYRKPNVIIPNGQTIILPKDKLLIVSAPIDQKKVIEYVSRTKEVWP